MEQKDYRLAAILYTDIVGFSRMMEADDDEAPAKGEAREKAAK